MNLTATPVTPASEAWTAHGGCEATSATRTARVLTQTRFASGIATLRLQIEGTPEFKWQPGQYVMLGLPGGPHRPFSIANAPHRGPGLEIHARSVPGRSGVASALVERVAPGDVVEVKGPYGALIPRPAGERPLLLIAGGTGIAPIKALLEHFCERTPHRPIATYWGVRTHDELYVRKDLEALSRGRGHVRFVPVVEEVGHRRPDSARSGRVSDAVVNDGLALAAFETYLSGPTAMVAAVKQCLANAGADPAHMHCDM